MTPEFEILFEWLPAPGVVDPLLASTWARYEFRAGGEPITLALDPESRTVRPGVFGSLLPLAEWVAGNWWNILHEPAPRVPAGSIRRICDYWDRGWLARHSPALSAEGQAYPDLRIFSSGEGNVVQWFPDPSPLPHRRVRFLGEGEVSLSTEALSNALGEFMATVLGRLRESLETGWEGLEEEWRTIGRSAEQEPSLCRHVARLGLDPYDIEGRTLESVETAIRTLPEPLLDELTAAAGADELDTCRKWILAGTDLLARKRNRTAVLDIRRRLPPLRRDRLPWETGYRRAREFRRTLQIPDDYPPNLEEVMETKLKLDPSRDVTIRRLRSARLDAVAGATEGGSAGILLAGSGALPARRFRIARALYALIAGTESGASVFSLLTSSHTLFQAESRAFAAELLLPAQLLHRELAAERYVPEERVESLARKYRVSPLVVMHQIENHRIAALPVPLGGRAETRSGGG